MTTYGYFYNSASYKLVYNNFDLKICEIFIKLIIIQLFAFKISFDLKHNVDHPNGLSKIVR